MTNIAKPIIKQIKDNREALDFFENILLPAEDEKTQEIIANFPTVYIHNWQDSGDFEVYVGESNDIFKRTRQHYDAAVDKSKWQRKLMEKDARLFIIGHEHFNKSLTMDIENRLMPLYDECRARKACAQSTGQSADQLLSSRRTG